MPDLTNAVRLLGFTISSVKKTLLASLLLLVCGLCPSLAHGQNTISLSANMVLDSDALRFPASTAFGSSANGSTHQAEALVTHGNYQFATWFRNDSNSEQSVILSRRSLSDPTNTWHDIDTGADFVNGLNWDAHNTPNLGISGDGRIHLAYDHHKDDLRYLTTKGIGKATVSNSNWNASIFVTNSNGELGERSKLNAQDSGSITDLTYPRFASKPNGDLVLVYRDGGSGNGDTHFVSYHSDNSNTTAGTVSNSNGVLNKRWGASHVVIDGNPGTYSDDIITNSTSRNAYLNGIDAGPGGKLHMTWTWRETSGSANHDIMYAYSEDGGDTWKNNSGTEVANKSTGQKIHLDSAGIIVQNLDSKQSLINQQGQTIDQNGGVHALMWHRRDNAPWMSEDGNFVGTDSAYYHYYRDPNPAPGVDLGNNENWVRNQLPTSEQVGSRPKIGYDANGDLYAVYTSSGFLVVANATQAAGFSDWSILYDGQDETQASGNRIQFLSSPQLDQERLLRDGVLSVYLQQSGTPHATDPTGTALRVLEFNVLQTVPEPSSLLALAAAGCLALSRRRRRAIG